MVKIGLRGGFRPFTLIERFYELDLGAVTKWIMRLLVSEPRDTHPVTTTKPDHDGLYHRFFSDPDVVAQLLREFVPAPWLEGLDLDGLERLRHRRQVSAVARRQRCCLKQELRACSTLLLDLVNVEQALSTKFHADTGERREGDLVWRIPRRDGGDAYVMLWLEFQSKTDSWMALRMLVYAGLLWQHLVREQRLLPDGRLPPILPIVLYNGDPRWPASVALRDLSSCPRPRRCGGFSPSCAII
jgi:hypothetical protein